MMIAKIILTGLLAVAVAGCGKHEEDAATAVSVLFYLTHRNEPGGKAV
jgi:ABC-type glycerol-3-phosphate transport system substrate-binding protein